MIRYPPRMPRWIVALVVALVLLLVILLVMPQLGAPAVITTILWIVFAVLVILAVVDLVLSYGPRRRV